MICTYEIFKQYFVILRYNILCCGRVVMTDSFRILLLILFIMSVFIYVINVSVYAKYFFSGFLCGAGCPVGG